MARKNIPLKDRAIIKSRLARGFSYSKALAGTSVKSKNTVMLIAREEKDDIGRFREEFIAIVTSLGGDAETQARQLAKAVTAQRPYGKKGKMYDDWKAQLEAIKYINQLAGIVPKEDGATRVNIFNDPSFLARYSEWRSG